MGTILKDSRICWLGLLKNAMVVKCLHVDIVETIVPLKDLNAFKQKCFRYSIFLQTIFLMYIYIHIVLSIKSSRTSIFATFMNKYWRHIFCFFTSEKSECSSMDSTTCFFTSLFGKSYDAGAFPWSLVNCLVLVDDILEGVVHLASDMGTLHLWIIPPVWCLLAPGN